MAFDDRGDPGAIQTRTTLHLLYGGELDRPARMQVRYRDLVECLSEHAEHVITVLAQVRIRFSCGEFVLNLTKGSFCNCMEVLADA